MLNGTTATVSDAAAKLAKVGYHSLFNYSRHTLLASIRLADSLLYPEGSSDQLQSSLTHDLSRSIKAVARLLQNRPTRDTRTGIASPSQTLQRDHYLAPPRVPCYVMPQVPRETWMISLVSQLLPLLDLCKNIGR